MASSARLAKVEERLQIHSKTSALARRPLPTPHGWIDEIVWLAGWDEEASDGTLATGLRIWQIHINTQLELILG